MYPADYISLPSQIVLNYLEKIVVVFSEMPQDTFLRITFTKTIIYFVNKKLNNNIFIIYSFFTLTITLFDERFSPPHLPHPNNLQNTFVDGIKLKGGGTVSPSSK